MSQCFGAIRSFGRLRVEGVSSCRERGDESESRFCDTPVCTPLVAALTSVAAGSSTCSGSHAGCTQGISMVGSFGVAYSAPLARIDQVRVMILRSGGARWPRRWQDLQRLSQTDALPCVSPTLAVTQGGPSHPNLGVQWTARMHACSASVRWQCEALRSARGARALGR